MVNKNIFKDGLKSSDVSFVNESFFLNESFRWTTRSRSCNPLTHISRSLKFLPPQQRGAISSACAARWTVALWTVSSCQRVTQPRANSLRVWDVMSMWFVECSERIRPSLNEFHMSLNEIERSYRSWTSWMIWYISFMNEMTELVHVVREWV